MSTNNNNNLTSLIKITQFALSPNTGVSQAPIPQISHPQWQPEPRALSPLPLSYQTQQQPKFRPQFQLQPIPGRRFDNTINQKPQCQICKCLRHTAAKCYCRYHQPNNARPGSVPARRPQARFSEVQGYELSQGQPAPEPMFPGGPQLQSPFPIPFTTCILITITLTTITISYNLSISSSILPIFTITSPYNTSVITIYTFTRSYYNACSKC